MNKIKKLQEDKYFRLLALLGRNPEISQRQLAKALDLSLGGVNYALRALVNRGMVKAQNFSRSEHKIAYAYMLTPQGFAEKTKLTAHFLKRKVQEYELLKKEIESLGGEL
jgi:EPS-associated MarR family transcriptional regulator